MPKSHRRRAAPHLFEVIVSYCPKTPGPYKYAVSVPALPGCLSDGRSEEEALQNVKEAISLYLSARRDSRERRTRLVEVVV